ncbi:MAG TPA: ADP-glyceromanno-heptose 6-epimerase [Victivallales bacterium]|nr:ADP-glyceromanno-heptose 6-epimerase [Victivallales bacterium]HRU00381.1 ADP-glyceromanno-heptose 6-epimerase [Victivallales bacterium]
MIIVTGGAGFIGSALVWQLNQNGIDEILIVDHLGESQKWENLRALRFSDYIEKEQFRNYLSNNTLNYPIEVIFHLGACSATTEKNASYLIDNNFNYSKELADFCIKRKIKFIYASSAATYGDGSKGWTDDENKLEELLPLNIYGYSKHLFDLWMKRKGFLKFAAGLKFTNIFGPNEWHKGEMRSVICKAYEQIKKTGKLCLFKSYKKDFKDGEQKRDFLYVKDAVEIMLHVYRNNLVGIFNVGSGKAETWNKLADAIFEAMKVKKNIEYIDMPIEIRDKYQYYSCADMRKLLSTNYKKNIIPLTDAVKEYINFYLEPHKHLGE